MGYKLALPPKRPNSIQYWRNKWANQGSEYKDNLQNISWLSEEWIQTDKNQANQNLAEIVSLVYVQTRTIFVQTQERYLSKHKNNICPNTRPIFVQTQEQYLSKHKNN